jgi:hypothetical protein
MKGIYGGTTGVYPVRAGAHLDLLELPHDVEEVRKHHQILPLMQVPRGAICVQVLLDLQAVVDGVGDVVDQHRQVRRLYRFHVLPRVVQHDAQTALKLVAFRRKVKHRPPAYGLGPPLVHLEVHQVPQAQIQFAVLHQVPQRLLFRLPQRLVLFPLGQLRFHVGHRGYPPKHVGHAEPFL